MSGRDGGGEVADVWVYSGAAGVAVGTFMLYVLVGACFSYFPRPKGLITREMVSNLSALLMQLLVPCMLLSALGQNLDAATLGQSAGLVVWATVNLLISFVIAYFVLPRCVRVPQHLFVPFVLALTFNNSGSMPIVLLEPLARSPALAADPDAYDRALAYIWVYGLVWQVMLWGFGAPAAEEVPLLVPPGGSMASPEAAAAGTDPIIFVVALVQACTPSAQFALVITQQAGLSRAAESLSLLYLVMYPLSLLTMPAWITLALSLVFGNA